MASLQNILNRNSSAESENLLNDSSCEGDGIYHEMELDQHLTVETKQANSCLSLRGSSLYVLAAIVASLGGVLFGYDLGIISGALLQLKPEFDLDCRQQEMVVSSMLFGATLGSLAGGYIIDYFGRRKTIIVNAFLFFAGALLLAFASSYAVLIVGRLIVGFGTSLSAIAECIYIAEIAPPKRRGLLVSLNEIGIASGLLLAYLIGHIFVNVKNGWRYMFGLSCIPAIIQGFGIIFLPSSPRWLVCQGKDSQALKVLCSLNYDSSPEEEISKIKQSLDLEYKFNICYLFGNRQHMKDRMLVGLGLVFFQQFTGQPSVLYYAPSIFESMGFHSHSAATLATVGIGLAKFFGTVITLSLVDKAGRRRFLLGGATLMTLSISLLFVITQCLHGDYRNELCTNTPGIRPRVPQPTNLTLMPTLEDTPYTPITTYTSNVSLVIPLIPTPTYTIEVSKSIFLVSSIVINTSHKMTAVASSPTSFPVSLPSARPGSNSIIKGNTTSSPRHSSTTRGNQHDFPAVVKYVAVLSLIMFAGAYSCGYGPVTWLVLSEIFPTEIKGRAFATTTVLNWGSNLVVSLTMLDLIDSLGASWTFLIYGVIGVLAIIFIYQVIPETKNRSLEEINALFSARNTTGICPCLTACCCHGNYSFISSSNTRHDTGLLQHDDRLKALIYREVLPLEMRHFINAKLSSLKMF